MIKRPMDLQTMYCRVDKGVFGGLALRPVPEPAPPDPTPPYLLNAPRNGSTAGSHPALPAPDSVSGSSAIVASGSRVNGVVANGSAMGFVDGSYGGIAGEEIASGLSGASGLVNTNGGSGRHKSDFGMSVGGDRGSPAFEAAPGEVLTTGTVASGPEAVACGVLVSSPRKGSASACKASMPAVKVDEPTIPWEVATGPFDHASFYRDMKLVSSSGIDARFGWHLAVFPEGLLARRTRGFR